MKITGIQAGLLAGLSIGLCATAAPAATLLGFYDFEGTGSAAFNDKSSAGANPTSTGAATISATGYEGQAASFAGGVPITIPININPGTNPDLTIGGWANVTDTSDKGFMGNDDGGWDRGLDLIGGTWRAPGGSPVDTNKAGTANAWQFISIVYNNATSATVYVGNDAGVPISHAPGGGSTSMVIGSYTVGGAHNWSGLIDNFFVFDDALSSTQIDTIRSGGSAGVLAVAGVPEPTSAAAIGVLALGLLRRRSRRAAAGV